MRLANCGWWAELSYSRGINAEICLEEYLYNAMHHGGIWCDLCLSALVVSPVQSVREKICVMCRNEVKGVAKNGDECRSVTNDRLGFDKLTH